MIASIIATVTLAVEAATFSYVLSIEHRRTLLESFKEYQNGKIKKSQAPDPAYGKERTLQEAQAGR